MLNEKAQEWGGVGIAEQSSNFLSGIVSGENTAGHLGLWLGAEFMVSKHMMSGAGQSMFKNMMNRRPSVSGSVHGGYPGKPPKYRSPAQYLRGRHGVGAARAASGKWAASGGKGGAATLKVASAIDKSVRGNYGFWSNRFGPGKRARREAMTKAFGKTGAKQLYAGLKVRSFGRAIGWAPLLVMAGSLVANIVTQPTTMDSGPPDRDETLGGTFYDTSVAYTQRKRALQMIHNSQYGGRSAFGNEASHMHG